MFDDDRFKTLKATFKGNFYETLKDLVKDLEVPVNIRTSPNLLLKITEDDSEQYGSKVSAQTENGKFAIFSVLCGKADWLYYLQSPALRVDLNMWGDTRCYTYVDDDVVTISFYNKVW